MLMTIRLSLRVSEVCSLRASSVKWSHGRRTPRCKVKGGQGGGLAAPKEVKEAVDHYLRLDRGRVNLEQNAVNFLGYDEE